MAVRTAETTLTDAAPLGAISVRRALVMVAGAALLVGSLVLIAPAIADLPDAWHRLEHGDGRWLQPGDVVELEVEGIGVLRNVVGQKRT
jgi:2-keto-4-pentenoate hydratase/2-oxohepta-3-ene-1,7-dioic acid hydratase in catechol pathway